MKSQYTQDVEFNSGFGALQTPVHLYTAAAICGIQAPRIDRRFRYLDLACGNGLTLSLLADAYPNGEFLGIDINPDHIEKARARAERAALENLAFRQGDVADQAAADLGEFDFCAISGAYAWLDSRRRAATRELMSAVVRPGGIAYLDYSAQPGIAQVGPLYHVLRELGNTFPGSSAEKLSAAAKLVNGLKENGARFFQIQQVAAARLDTILQNPPEDEAHEVFNLQDNGLWSNAVIDEFGEAGFDYAGNAGLHHNLSTLAPEAVTGTAGAELPVALREMLFDVKYNVAQRRDIYVRRGADGGPKDLGAMLDDLPLYAIDAALGEKSRRALNKHFSNYDFCAAPAGRFAQLARGATTFGDLFEQLKANEVSAEEGLEMTRHFLAARLISIAASSPLEVGDVHGFGMGSALNENILADDIGAEHARPFASPVAGSRVLLPLKDRLYLWRLVGLDLNVAWERLGELQGIFRGANDEKLSREGFIETIETSLPAFRQHAVPELLRLGIVRPAEKRVGVTP